MGRPPKDAGKISSGIKGAKGSGPSSPNIRQFLTDYAEISKSFISSCLSFLPDKKAEELEACPFLEYMRGLKTEPQSIKDFADAQDKKISFLKQKGIEEITLGDINRPELAVVKESVSPEMFATLERTNSLSKLREIEVKQIVQAGNVVLSKEEREGIQSRAKVAVDTSAPSVEVIPVTLAFVNSILRRV